MVTFQDVTTPAAGTAIGVVLPTAFESWSSVAFSRPTSAGQVLPTSVDAEADVAPSSATNAKVPTKATPRTARIRFLQFDDGPKVRRLG
jgi:hypothetical protein